MPYLPTLSSFVASIHLLTYSTLLGAQLYQSFVMVKIAYQTLPYKAFMELQKRAFPIYFRCQSLLLVAAAATIPPFGPTSLIMGKGNWIPYLVAGITAGLNLVIYGPRTSRFMMLRGYQAEVDARKAVGGTASDEMTGSNQSFKWNHAMSII